MVGRGVIVWAVLSGLFYTIIIGPLRCAAYRNGQPYLRARIAHNN
jgi:hypothetical protein